jgi:hypothetical protein
MRRTVLGTRGQQHGLRVEDQVGEERPLLRDAEREGARSVRDLDRPEDAELQFGPPRHDGRGRVWNPPFNLLFERVATELRPWVVRHALSSRERSVR